MLRRGVVFLLCAVVLAVVSQQKFEYPDGNKCNLEAPDGAPPECGFGQIYAIEEVQQLQPKDGQIFYIDANETKADIILFARLAHNRLSAKFWFVAGINCSISYDNTPVLEIAHCDRAAKIFAKPGKHTITTQVLLPQSAQAAPKHLSVTTPFEVKRRYHHKVIALHLYHDAAISVSFDGEIMFALECERYFNIRHFAYDWEMQMFTMQFQEVANVVFSSVAMHGEQFDEGVLLVTERIPDHLFDIVKQIIPAKKWRWVDHHMAHAALGFYDSPFDRALVISLDGGGNDGLFNVYKASRADGIELLFKEDYNLGIGYGQFALLMPEVYTNDDEGRGLSGFLQLAGKSMAYSALGRVREEWKSHIRWVYAHLGLEGSEPESVSSPEGRQAFADKLGQKLIGLKGQFDVEPSKDLAATVQAVLTDIAFDGIRKAMGMVNGKFDGIVVTGGCALNVKTNQDILEEFRFPVHVPSAPNDGGIAVGGAWVAHPPRTQPKLQYTGAPVWDGALLPDFVKRWPGQKVDVEELAALLANGAVIAVLRGRAEFGPRALGHRSLLAYPDIEEVKSTLNRLKGREQWRPVAPMVATEYVSDLFDVSSLANFSSPYMSFAPKLRPEAREKFPAISHLDGTARVQTVSAKDDTWLHALLLAVGQRRGVGVLANTSFNVRGRPIINRLRDALELLQTQPELNYVVIENYLFAAPEKR